MPQWPQKTSHASTDDQNIGSLLWKLRGLEGDEIAALRRDGKHTICDLVICNLRLRISIANRKFKIANPSALLVTIL
jgi:hypothetical protein